jgi:hypothetical protein
LKALDIVEANRLETSTSISTPLVAASLTSANLSALSITHSPRAQAANSSSGSPRAAATASAAATERITPARQLLDAAADVLTAELALFSGSLLLEYDDYFLAAAVLLEKVSLAGVGFRLSTSAVVLIPVVIRKQPSVQCVCFCSTRYLHLLFTTFRRMRTM